MSQHIAFFKDQPIFGPRGPAGPDGNPVGTIITYMGLTAPADYLVCDGAVHDISDYPELARFFAQQFGSPSYFGGDGTTTFAVPDMRNLFLRGYHGDAEEQLSGDVGVRQEPTTIPYARYGFNEIAGSSIGGEWNAPQYADTIGRIQHYDKYSRTAYVGDYSMPWDYTTRPVNMAVLYCIKTSYSASAENIYSLEERRIGTWVDGSPVYQITGSGLTGQSNTWTAICTIPGLKYVVNLFVCQTEPLNGKYHVLPSAQSYVGYDNNNVLVYNADKNLVNLPLNYTVQYVKEV